MGYLNKYINTTSGETNDVMIPRFQLLAKRLNLLQKLIRQETIFLRKRVQVIFNNRNNNLAEKIVRPMNAAYDSEVHKDQRETMVLCTA